MHVAIIMDGNRRFAKRSLVNPLHGHIEGAKRVKEVIKFVNEHPDINELSLYTFSSKNFSRDKKEVDFLMDLFRKYFNELKEGKEKVRIVFAGDKELFPKDISDMMKEIELRTNNITSLRVNFCMGYDGQEELINSVKTCNELGLELTGENIANHLFVKTPVDLMIRPGGENRLSGFLLWQSSYAELYFTKKLWPEFDNIEFEKAIEEYNSRNRRFGK